MKNKKENRYNRINTVITITEIREASLKVLFQNKKNANHCHNFLLSYFDK